MPEMPVISVLDRDMTGHEGRRRGNHFTSARTMRRRNARRKEPFSKCIGPSLCGTSAGPAMGPRKWQGRYAAPWRQALSIIPNTCFQLPLSSGQLGVARFHTLLPWGQSDAEAPEKFLVGKSGVLRSVCGGRILARGNWQDAGSPREGLLFQPRNLRCKPVPGGASTGCDVIDAAGVPERRMGMAAQELRACVSERFRRGRSADLVGHHAQFLLFPQQAANRQQEVPAARRVHPARAQYQVVAIDAADRLLARELTAAVGVERIREVLLEIRRVLGPVEHVIGRVVEEQGSRALRFFGENGYGYGVDRLGGIPFGFRLIDRGVRRGIDEHIGPY